MFLLSSCCLRMHLTDISIRALKAPESGQRDYWDDSIKGFGVRVSQGGRKTFILLLNRNRRAIGKFPQLSLAQARAEAKKLLAQIELGRTFTSITFAEALEHYLEQHVRKNNKASSAYEAERVLRRHYDFGSRILDSIRAPEIMRIIDALPPIAANHAFTHARAFFRWCVRRRYLDRHPLEGLPLPNKPASRDRVLTDDELRVIWHAAQQFPFPFGHIVSLLILTGQRVGETSALRWDYIDLDQRLITLPGPVVKNNTTHTFPIGDAAAGLIASLPRTGEFLFPSRADGKGFDGHNKAKSRFEKSCNAAWQRLNGDAGGAMQHWTLHDLRRTFSTIHARIGTPPHVTEALLNHKIGTRSPIQRIYDRHTYIPEMRTAIGNYEKYLTTLLKNPSEPTSTAACGSVQP
jgi:integrase